MRAIAVILLLLVLTIPAEAQNKSVFSPTYNVKVGEYFSIEIGTADCTVLDDGLSIVPKMFLADKTKLVGVALKEETYRILIFERNNRGSIPLVLNLVAGKGSVNPTPDPEPPKPKPIPPQPVASWDALLIVKFADSKDKVRTQILGDEKFRSVLGNRKWQIVERSSDILDKLGYREELNKTSYEFSLVFIDSNSRIIRIEELPNRIQDAVERVK